jgi:hypothetical protein
MFDLDLDVDTPEKVPAVLRDAAEKYREAATELQSAWQDSQAGKVWEDFATILERAAESCGKAIQKRIS